MSRIRRLVAWQVLAILFFTGTVVAQGRGPPATTVRRQALQSEDSPVVHARKLAGLNGWLGRLVARFQVRYSIFDDQPIPIGGGNDLLLLPSGAQVFFLNCNAIGSGSGVSCLSESTDKTIGDLQWTLLFGVDPDRLEIRFAQIDSKGYITEKSGSLAGDTVTFDSECVAQNCKRMRTRIYAPPGGRTVEIFIEQSMGKPEKRLPGSRGSSDSPSIAYQMVLQRQ